jgi:hypothetical protein
LNILLLLAVVAVLPTVLQAQAAVQAALELPQVFQSQPDRLTQLLLVLAERPALAALLQTGIIQYFLLSLLLEVVEPLIPKGVLARLAVQAVAVHLTVQGALEHPDKEIVAAVQ